MTNKIIIYGSGGLGRGIADLIDSINKSKTDKWELLGFVDDSEENEQVNGLPYLGGIDYLLNFPGNLNVVLAFGSPRVKEGIYQKLYNAKHIKFPNLIHPGVEVSKFNEFGFGNVITKGVSMSSNITMGNFNLIHYNCSVGHDVSIGNYNSVFPLTSLSGYVFIEDKVEIGTNTAVIPNVSFANNSIVGAGSTIINDIKKGSKVVGVPGKEI